MHIVCMICVGLFSWATLHAQSVIKTFSLKNLKTEELNNFIRNDIRSNTVTQKIDSESSFYYPNVPRTKFRLKTEKGDFDFEMEHNPQISFENADLEEPYFTGKLTGNENSFVQMILMRDYFAMSIYQIKDIEDIEIQQDHDNHEHNKHDDSVIEIMHAKHMSDKMLSQLNRKRQDSGFIIYSTEDVKKETRKDESIEFINDEEDPYKDKCLTSDEMHEIKSSQNNKIPTNHLGKRTLWLEVHPWDDYVDTHGYYGGAAHISYRLSKMFVPYSVFSHIGTDICATLYHMINTNLVISYENGNNSVLHNWVYTGSASNFPSAIGNQLQTAINSSNKNKLVLGITDDAYQDSNNNQAVRGQAVVGGYKQNYYARRAYTYTADFHIPIHELYHTLDATHANDYGWGCWGWNHFWTNWHAFIGHVHGSVMSYVDDYTTNLSYDNSADVSNHIYNHFTPHPEYISPSDPNTYYSLNKSMHVSISGNNTNKGKEYFDGRINNSPRHITYSFYVPSGQGGNYKISLEEANFNTYLYLLDGSYNLIHKDDNGYPESYPYEPYEGAWSQMNIHLNEGNTYRIIASGYGTSSTGDFKLKISGELNANYKIIEITKDEIQTITIHENMREPIIQSNREFQTVIAKPMFSYEEYANMQLSKIEEPSQYSGTDYGYSAKKTVNLAESSKDNLISVFPNPAHHIITVNLDSQNFEEGIVQINDIQGKNLLTVNVNGQHELELDVSNWSNGTYFLQLLDNEQRQMKQVSFIKE